MLPVYLVLGGALLIWSTAYPAISAAVKVYAPTEMAAFRMTVGGALILLLCCIKKRRLTPERADLPACALTGLIGMAAYNILLGYGQRHVTAAESSLLVAVTPVFTVLACVIFLRERVGRKTLLGVAVSFGGVAVMALSHLGDANLGSGLPLILLAAMTQALLTILQKRLVQKYTPLEVTAFGLQFAVLAMLPLGWRAFPKALADPFGEATLSLVYLAVFSLVLGYVAWAYVLQHMSAARASSFLYAMPAGTALTGYLWLGEVPENAAFAGGAIALAGVAIVNWRRGQGRNLNPADQQE